MTRQTDPASQDIMVDSAHGTEAAPAPNFYYFGGYNGDHVNTANFGNFKHGANAVNVLFLDGHSAPVTKQSWGTTIISGLSTCKISWK